MNANLRYRWTILGLIFFCQLAQAISYQGIPPILGILVQSLHISYTQAGGLMSLYSLPRILMALPSGILVDRYGTKRVGRFSLLFLTIGTAMVAFGDSYGVLGAGRFLSGIGTTFLIVVALHGVTSWFLDREMGMSMGIFHTAMPLGTILSLNFVGVSASHFGWRAPIFTIFVMSFAAFALFLKLYRERDIEKNVSPEPLNLLKSLKRAGWRIWLVGSMWGFLNAAVIPYFTYAPDYFVSQGRGLGQAGLLASYPMWASIVLAPMVGIFIDRVGKKRLLIFIGFIASAILFYFIPRFPQHAAIFAISLGVFAAIQPTPIFSLPAEFLHPSVRGLGFGIIATSGAIGMAFGPYIAGSLRDFTGDYLWSFNAMAILSALGVLPILLLKRGSSPVKQTVI